ncbi:MAG: alanine--glyoxylate aminotransferase family protein [Oligoflexales bacterium]|nr:alanine--glyoxylate aminotransferase family protein [Oligoflexales bacterium]
MNVASFVPKQKTLMGPGPSDVSSRVLQAMAKPTIGHLDPDFVGFMNEVQSLLRYAFKTENEVCFPISAPGSAGMEACFVNLVEPGEEVIICQNGVFGMRMQSIVERIGAKPILVKDDWGKAVDPQKVEDAFKNNPNAKLLAFVHAETSTGACSDAKAIAAIAKQNDCLSIVDTVTSLGGCPLEVDGWGLDAVYSGSQKCLSAPPGLSPVTFSERAVAKLKARKSQVPSWFLDFNLVLNYWDDKEKTRSYHHTAPVNALYGLRESLVILQEEGLESSWKRHRERHIELREGLVKMGFEFLVAEGDRLPQLNAVRLPAGADDAALRSYLLDNFQLEVGAGLGPLAGKILRIGLMGYAANKKNIAILLGALDSYFADSPR